VRVTFVGSVTVVADEWRKATFASGLDDIYGHAYNGDKRVPAVAGAFSMQAISAGISWFGLSVLDAREPTISADTSDSLERNSQ
jgi:virulence-associated protein VapD